MARQNLIEVHDSMKEFVKCLESIERQYGFGGQVFIDWMEVAFNYFCVPHKERSEVGQYIADKYGRDNVMKFHRMREIWIMAMGKEISDVQDYAGEDVYPTADLLGAVWESHCLSKAAKKWQGIYFTPEPVCMMMAAMLAVKGFREYEDGRKMPLWIGEPCSGSGRMILATHSVWLGDAISRDEWIPDPVYIANDLNRGAYLMTALNMYIHGMRGQVTQGNGLNPDDTYSVCEIGRINMAHLRAQEELGPRKKLPDDGDDPISQAAKDTNGIMGMMYRLILQNRTIEIETELRAKGLPVWLPVIIPQEKEESITWQRWQKDKVIWEMERKEEEIKSQIQILDKSYEENYSNSLFEAADINNAPKEVKAKNKAAKKKRKSTPKGNENLSLF